MALNILPGSSPKEKIKHTIPCRNCGHTLEYEEGETSVYCGYCDTSTDIGAPGAVTPPGSAPRDEGLGLSGMALVAVKNMKSPETALRYLRALEASYDFSFILTNPFALEIPELEETVDELKLTVGEDPKSWEFAIRVRALPLQRKIAYIKEIGERLAELFLKNDEEQLYSDFDFYRNSIHVLKDKKEAINKAFEGDLQILREVGKAKDDAEAVALIESINKEIDALVEYKAPQEVPSIKKAAEKRNKEIADKLLEKGIVAETKYQGALELIAKGDNLGALKNLVEIGDYKDARALVADCNTYSVVKDLLTMGKDRYYFATEAVKTADTGKKKKKQKPQPKGKAQQTGLGPRALAIRKIVDGEPDFKGDPLACNIREVVDSFDSYLYYIGHDGKLYFDDLRSPLGTQKVLDPYGNYYLDDLRVDRIRSVSYFLQKRPIIRQGCKAKFKPNPEDMQNGLRLCKLEPVKGDVAFGVVIPALERIVYWKGDYVGYWESVKDPAAKRGCALARKGPSFHKEYNILRLSTGERKPLLKYDDDLVFMDGSRIYFTRYLNTKYNLALHVVDFDTGETQLLIENIYSAIMVDHGKVFYTIGNTYNKRLFSYDLETKEKKEILRRFDGFADCFGGYFYLYRGYGYNRALIKVRCDGEGEPIALAMGMDKGPSFFKNGYFFYTTNNRFSSWGGKELHKVRVDGKEDVTLDREVNKVLHIADNRIYYSAAEYVDEVFAQNGVRKVEGLSLYSFDMFGNDLRKEVFAFDRIEVFENELVYCIEERCSFKFKRGKALAITTRDIDHYFRYDLNTLETEKVLMVGYPHEEAKGCFGKKKGDIVFEPIPVKRPYDKEKLS